MGPRMQDCGSRQAGPSPVKSYNIRRPRRGMGRRGRLRRHGGGDSPRPVPAVTALAVALAAALFAAAAPLEAAAAGAGAEAGAGAPISAATHVDDPTRTVRGAGAPAFVPGAAAANATHMFVVDAGNGSGGGGGRVLAFEIGPGAAGEAPRPSHAIAVRGIPYGVAVNGTGHLFVSVPESGRVAVFGPGGEPAGELPAAGSGAAPLDWPAGVAVGPDGRVYVAERNAGRVAVFGAGGGGGPSMITEAGPAGRLLAPAGVAVGPATGELYVADAAAGAVHAFGPDGSHARTMEVPPLDGARGSPFGVAVDPRTGAVRVASLLQGALHSYDASGAPAGAPAPISPRHGAAPDASQPRPLSVAARGDGMLVVTDAANGRAVLAHPNGTVHSVLAGRGAAGDAAPFAPADAAAGAGAALYVADAGAGSAAAYAPGHPGAAPRQLWESAEWGGAGGPAGVAVDGAGRVLVSGRGGSGGVAVRILSAGGGEAAGLLYEGGGGGRPAGVAAGPRGEVAVADPSAGAVRIVGAGGSLLGSIGGLDDPVDAAFMSDGSLVVAERGAHAVRIFGPGPSGEWGAPEDAGTAASLGLGAGGVLMPEAVAVDGGDRILVADAGGGAALGPRVQAFDHAGRLVSRLGGGAGGAALGAPAGLGAGPWGTVLVSSPAAGAVRALAALDSEPPAVASFAVAAGGGERRLGPYSSAAASVTFTEPVLVRAPPPGGDGAAGPPILRLNVSGNGGGRMPLASDEFCGPGNGTAPYASGSGTDTLLFTYTVLPGEHARQLGYAPGEPVGLRGSSITDLAGNRASLSMPAAGAGGAGVSANGSAGSFLAAGLLAANASAADSRAAGLAACDFNRWQAAEGAPAGPFLGLAAVEVPGALDAEASGGWADRRSALALGALRASHAGGSGPAAYVTTLPDEALATPTGPLQNSTAAGYAAGAGVLLVATAASTSVSLDGAAPGGGSGSIYRMGPGGAHLAHALSSAIGPEIDVLFPIVQADAFGEPAPARHGAAPFSHGLYGLVLGHLRDAGGVADGFDAGLLNYDRTRRAEFNFTAPHGGWGGDAAELDLNLALLKGQVGAGRVAVLYLGSAAEYVKLAEAAAGLPSLSATRWLAAGGVAASPLVERSEAAASLAASTGLEAVAFGTGGGGVRGGAAGGGAGSGAGSADAGHDPAGAADRIDALVGPSPGGAALAYSAYDAVQVLGRAASMAAKGPGNGGEGGEGAARVPSAREVSQAMGDAALAYRGALGNVRLDAATGSLDLPITHDVWKIGGDARAWERASVKRGLDTCSVSLASPDLDFGRASARAASAPLEQRIANTGSLVLVGVALGPSEWTVRNGSGGGAAGAALPAGLTEYIDESAHRAARFAPVSGGPGGAAVVAMGLEPAEESGLLLRLNLRSLQSLDGIGGMEQAIEYTASCDWRAATRAAP